MFEELEELGKKKNELRNFGLVVGGVFLALTAWLFWKENDIFRITGVAGILLFLPGLVFPAVLRYPYIAWMSLALMLGWLMTRVILFLLYYVIITPIRFLSGIFGHRFLDLSWNSKCDSYWNNREDIPFSPERCEKQF